MPASLKSGELDRRISIEAVSKVQGSTGAITETWAELAEVWAKYRPKHGREFLASGAEITAEADAVFTIRWRGDVTTAMRITYGGEQWDILSIVEYGRRVGLEIIAKTRARA